MTESSRQPDPVSPVLVRSGARAARWRGRTAVVLATVAALVLVGSGGAWAWWQVTSTLASVTASTVVVPQPTGTVTCVPQATNDVWGLYNNRVDVSWNAATGTMPAGSTRRYVVRLTGSDSTVKDKYVADAASPLTTAVLNTDLAPSATTTYSIRVMTVADFAQTSWTSAPIGAVAVTATRKTFFVWTYYELSCGAG
ncbi:hypothetical protein [Cellulomonas sp. ICMP 17802]|uniref:hypothetical protein n=1 Tax=Cellulomonas sp. ICMP 17802 TaxID=3239199 RepID=UPI00351B7EC5